MALRCLRTDGLLTAAIAGRASDAEHLELEAHLEECAACRAKQVALEPIRRLKQWQPPSLSAAAHVRVRQALLAGGAAPAPPRERRSAAAVGVALAAACALVAAGWWLAGRAAAPGAVRPVAGAVAILATADGGAVLRAPTGGAARVGPALVELAGGTELRWRPGVATIEIVTGSIVVDVAPQRGRPFMVETPAFIVHVVGTRFRVDLQGVATERGQVRVMGRDGRRLAELGPAGRWALAAPAAPAPASAPLVAPAVGPPATGPASAPAPAAGRAGVARASPGSRVAAAARDEGRRAGLREARHALSAGRGEAARALLRPLLGAERAIAVEARALMAESYLVEGRHRDAMAQYRQVVRDFGGTSQAESALYAVGQLEAERGDRAAAVAALERYLARYPGGRFAREARARLARLAPPP